MQAFAKIGLLAGMPSTTFVSPSLLAHLLVLAACPWLGLHALESLQPGQSATRRARPRRAKPLRIADRWG